MDDITKSAFWCEFGCEVRIYYDRLEFSNEKKLIIPRNVKTDKIHDCPNLDPSDPDVNFMPEDQDVYEEMADEHGGHFWDDKELGERALALHETLEGYDNLEFKLQREAPKAVIIEFLNEVPDFTNEISISSAEKALPACLQNTSETIHYDNVGSFPPAALLGLFYEMDGSLEDAKKCFEIQTEISSGSQKDYYQQRIEEINRQIILVKKIDVIEKQIAEKLKKPQTSQQEQDQISLQAVISKTYDFELNNLRTYAFDKINSNDRKTILKETVWYNHNNKTLIDKVREMQAKEETDTILPLDPTDWDYLDLADKIKILNPYVNRNIINYLHNIRRHRNITSHPKRYKKQDLEQRNKMIILYIQECIDFFERSKRA